MTKSRTVSKQDKRNCRNDYCIKAETLITKLAVQTQSISAQNPSSRRGRSRKAMLGMCLLCSLSDLAWLVVRPYTTRLRPPAIWNRRARVLNMTVDLAATNLPLAITHDLHDQSHALSAIPSRFPPLSVVPSS